MNSLELLSKLTGLLANLSPDDMLLPLRVNDVPINEMFIGLHLSSEGDYINILTNDN